MTRDLEDLFSENCKTLLKKNGEKHHHLNKWSNVPGSCIRRLNIVKVSIFPKFICRFTIIPIKIPGNFLVEICKLILKFIWKCKEPMIAKTPFKKNKVGALKLPDFKTYYKARVKSRQ